MKAGRQGVKTLKSAAGLDKKRTQGRAFIFHPDTADKCSGQDF